MLREAARPRSRYGLHSLQTVWVSPCSNSISALTMRPGPVGARLSPPKKLPVRCNLLQSPGDVATWRTPHCAARAAPCSWRPSVAHTVAQSGPSRDNAAGDLSQGRHGPFCSTPTSHQSFFLHPPHLLLTIVLRRAQPDAIDPIAPASLWHCPSALRDSVPPLILGHLHVCLSACSSYL